MRSCGICGKEILKRRNAVQVHQRVEHTFHRACLDNYVERAKHMKCPICSTLMDYSCLSKFLPSDSILLASVQSRNLAYLNSVLSDPDADFILGMADSFLTAAELGFDEVMEILIETPFKISSEVHWEALRIASKKGHIDVIEYLLSLPFACPQTALEMAADYGQLELVKFLMTRPELEDRKLCIEAMCHAAIEEYLEVVAFMASFPDMYLEPAFESAARTGNLPAVRYLSTFRTVDLKRMFYVAATESQYAEVVEYLSAFANLDPAEDKTEIIMAAAQMGHIEVVEYLIDFFGVKSSSALNSIFTAAIRCGHVQVIKRLLEFTGVDPAANNNAPIIEACSQGYFTIFKYLESLPDVDPLAQDGLGIILAASNGRLEVLEYLSGLPNRFPKPYREAMCKAIENGRLEVVKFLSRLPEVDMSSHSHELYDLAVQHRNSDIANYLSTFRK